MADAIHCTTLLSYHSLWTRLPQFDEKESLIEIVLRQLRCSSVHVARFASLIYMYGCPLFFHLSFYDDGSFDTTISSKRKLEADLK